MLLGSTQVNNAVTFKVRDWNGIELLAQFIGPVLTLVNFNTKTFTL